MKNIGKGRGAYVAVGESPVLLCSYGKTPAKALKAMAKLVDEYMDLNENTIVIGMSSMYDDDEFFMNLTVSSWA